MNNKFNILFSVLLLFISVGLKAEEIAVIVHPSFDASDIDRQTLSRIFLGSARQLTPYDQPASSAIRARFYQLATGRSAEQVKATWSKLVFSGQANFPEELINSKAIKKTIAADPKGISYIEKSAVDESVKVVMTLE
jgi:ABC-type phosphate transport system substrate-binding protein